MQINPVDRSYLRTQWRENALLPSESQMLDDALVNEPLQWLYELGYGSVRSPFERGLFDFLDAADCPEKLFDTVRYMYQALEEIARIVTAKPDKSLVEVAGLLLLRLGLDQYYMNMLDRYIAYANKFGYPSEAGDGRELPLVHEVEAFIYITGSFIRMAIEKLKAAS